MAEALGVVASVAGLISLADIVVGRGYKFLKAIKDAEKSIKSLVHEVNVLSGVLHSLSNTIQLLEEDEDEVNFESRYWPCCGGLREDQYCGNEFRPSFICWF
jgi:hypothetical protein